MTFRFRWIYDWFQSRQLQMQIEYFSGLGWKIGMQLKIKLIVKCDQFLEIVNFDDEIVLEFRSFENVRNYCCRIVNTTPGFSSELIGKRCDVPCAFRFIWLREIKFSKSSEREIFIYVSRIHISSYKMPYLYHRQWHSLSTRKPKTKKQNVHHLQANNERRPVHLNVASFIIVHCE